ncbi:MAG: N-acetylmuramoyl-L-alanine amidase, partial [Caldilineaceae bacterium]
MTRNCGFQGGGSLGYNTPVRQKALVRAQRIIVGIIVAALAGIALLAAPFPILGLFTGEGDAGSSALFSQGQLRAAVGKQVAIISGHAGNDSGAVCEESDGTPTLTEASINAAVAAQAAERLRRAGAFVTILDEFDPRLESLRADLLISLHADSCIDASGYKAASHALRTSREDDRLVACIDQYYPAATALPHHPNTVTHNMTEYHAFGKIAPETPAAILELGFLGGDRLLLE